VLLLFGATIFLSAGLLFLVQPLVAKVLLPTLGGSPAVWNTCMVFFQVALLLGYGYSHALNRLRLRTATAIHAAVILIPLAALSAYRLSPPAGSTPGEAHPIPWLLGTLALTCGLPFVALATTGPLLQRWFSLTPHPRARDPYFLYAASNTGSVLALLGYPFLLEWLLPLEQQQGVWIGGYLGFVSLTLVCAGVLARRPPQGDSAKQPSAPDSPPPTALEKLRWVALAAVPSSLVLGATQYLSTDIAAIPLLWVLPLAIYLLTFVAAFSQRRPPPLALLDRFWAGAVVWLVLCLLIDARSPILLVFALHLLGLGLACLLLHRRLASERPAPAHLTGFYLWIAVGGALGGSFNALLGPLLFDTVLEYPLMLAAVSFLRPPRPQPKRSDGAEAPPAAPARRWLSAAVPLGALAVYLLLDVALRAAELRDGTAGRLAVGIPVVLVYMAYTQRLAFALGMSVLLGVAQTNPGEAELNRGLLGRDVEVVRTFFGVHRVNQSDGFVALLHGSTMHGLERRDAPGEPLLYYHRFGPAGDVIRHLGQDRRLDRVGLVGLGCGAMAAYASPGQRWTFFEIDPEVVRLAKSHFSFVPQSAGQIEVELGDGRLTLEQRVAPGELGLLLLDAFSSDAIPTHLLTREALRLYLSRLRPDGLLLLHISNRYFDLAPVVATLAAELHLSAVHWLDADGYEDRDAQRVRQGLQASHWVLLARRADQLPALPNRWRPLVAREGDPLWTDDYTDLLAALGKESQ
jgi:SAM-dependent methyltransferase